MTGLAAISKVRPASAVQSGRPGPSLRLSVPGRHVVNSVPWRSQGLHAPRWRTPRESMTTPERLGGVHAVARVALAPPDDVPLPRCTTGRPADRRGPSRLQPSWPTFPRFPAY